MKRFVWYLATLALLFSITRQTEATIIGVTANTSSLGVAASIVAAPASVIDDNPGAENSAQQGFNERQGVQLANALKVDLNPHTGPIYDPDSDGFNTIAAGTWVDSHMIFFNTGPGNPGTNTHSNVTWTFDSTVLGVMSDYFGKHEIASSPILGAAGTTYPGTFAARGLQGGDAYTVSGNTITLTMKISEPGDWVRVVTASTVPEPSTYLLFGIGILSMFGIAYRRQKKAA